MVQMEGTVEMAPESSYGDAVRAEFLKVLASRRCLDDQNQLQVLPCEAPTNYRTASLEDLPLPRLPGEEETKHLEEERLLIRTDASDQGQLPVLIVKAKLGDKRRPAVVILHSTNKSKDFLRPLIDHYALHGYIAVGIDGRHHGQRASSPTAYDDALVHGWKTGEHMPFIFDTVWDTMRLVDYLVTRQDVDPGRIGMTGISLGGMITFYAVAADTRFAAGVPLIGVQNFTWAVENNEWRARVGSIPRVFEVAAKDLGKTSVDTETVVAVWKRLTPGLMHRFDVHHILPAVVPRPLLILNGERDPRCPVQGLESCIMEAAELYEKAGYPEHFKFLAEKDVDHRITTSMLQEARNWFDKYLKSNEPN